MKYKYFYLIISALVIVPGLISLILWRLKPSIDFTGGAVIEIKVNTIKEKPLKESIGKNLENSGFKVSSIQETTNNTYLLRLKDINKNENQLILDNLEKEYGKVEEVRFESVGPIIGSELIKKTIIGIIIASGLITLYVARQFKDKKYGICAILAMFHDTLVVLGIFSLLGHFLGVEIDILFVTAVLTVLSFSVHDTVIVYDRIRESVKLNPRSKFEDLVNKAVAETLSRSINNSMTIIFMLFCLYLFGGQSIRWFAFTLLVGTISGTYSSTFTAAPLLIIWNNLQKKSRR